MFKPVYILLLIIIIYLVAGIASINAISITWDEPSHFSFGMRMLKGIPERPLPEKDNSKMPVSALNALPRAAEQVLNKNLHKNDNGLTDIMHGRYITLLFSVFTILLVYKWAKELYGVNAGLFSAFLFAFCPNNQSNAVMVTTDTYAVFFLAATMYALWQYCNNKNFRNLLGFAALLALSQLAKQSLFHLYVLAPLCIFMYVAVNKEKIRVKTAFKNILFTVLISWIVINAGFVFYQVNNRLGDFHFMSSLFKTVQGIFPAGFPVPVSASFVEGLDQAKYYDQLGGGYAYSSFGTVNMFGKTVPGSSLWYFYFVTLFFKTPVSCLIFIGWAGYYLGKRFNVRSFISNEFFLLAPVVYFLLLMSFLYKTQCGIRHIIFVYPLLYILCGSIIPALKTKLQRGIIVLLCLLLVIGLGRYWNNYYAYTNELVFDKKNAVYWVGTGNLNINQADHYMHQYLQLHPDAKYASQTPAKGRFIISVDEYMDVWNTGEYKWLRQYRPVGQVAYCYLLFDIK
ncbi:MAG: glycosyltransferase family 39 protein [Ferruginibacter sp.]